ncbi:MAG TPA: hypothetical protein VGP00_04610 [Nocardioides sp.]|jgi:uncharacterized membrane protein YphA (DoxX/SURF4 family)|nr:hypothetical protein [Nocardioides sp.]
MKLSNLPTRLAAGGYILHSGLEKWNGGPEQAQGLHGFASGAFPFLAKVNPPTFLKLLAAGEIAVGAALLVPLVPDEAAGIALSGFSAGLVALYLRTPGLRKPGSIWPTQEGIGVSKDVWLLGVGASLLADGLAGRKSS